MEWKTKGTRGWGCLRIVSASFVIGGFLFAQESPPSAAPPLEVIKLKWEKEVRLPRNFDPSVIPTGATFSDPASRTSSAAPTNPADATRAATSAQSAARGSGSAFPATPSRLPVYYVYSMKIRNAGVKTIQGVAWDYIFIDATNGTELGSHQFLSYEKVVPEKTTTFRSQLRSPPIRVIQASNSQKNHPRSVERAVIQCVLYADDTTWRNPQARVDICSLLKNGKRLMKQKPGARASH